MLQKLVVSTTFLSAMFILGQVQISAQTTDLRSPAAALPTHPALKGDGAFITSNDGTLIAVQDSGPRDGLPLLLIHGFSHDSEVWYQQIASPQLSRYRLITMDLRGHGYSGKPTDAAAYANISIFANDINAVIHELHLFKPILIGWSLGGFSVQGYLEKYGDSEIGGVDLVDSIACTDAACQATIESAAALSAVTALASTDSNTEQEGVEEFVNLESGGTKTSGPTLSPTQQLVLQEIMQSAPQFTRLQIVANVGSEIDVLPQTLRSLRVPVLIQHGENDPFFSASLIPAEVKLIRNATVRLYPNVGHIPFFLAPRQFNSDLAQWIQTQITKEDFF